MEDYNKVIESLGVRYIKAKNLVLQQPFTVRNSYDMGNNLILLHKGRIAFGDEEQVIEEGEMLFIPGGRATRVSYGQSGGKLISNDDLITNKDKFFHSNSDLDLIGDAEESHSFVSFEAKVFDSVNFFSSLDVPAFVISNNSKLANLVIKVVEESLQDLPGRERLITIYTENIVVEIVRYILKNKMFVEQLATNSTYFKDPRLIDLFNYIKENIGGDLSNKVLSGVANVSEDYVGQYFKMLTGINPQDYIEYQRMERAVFLLRTTKKSIRDIGKEVGYKDTAYFCRRFKMMFGIPAGKMRRRESAMNI
ncbi:AraC family transcriptional regulator [Hymenobacter aerilatus]|uniref:AraC family transcriptional regulator n=4 Tax=Hymenobacter TaxID=89966 RepID=A0A8T9SV31_9BACT|nr:MULTISPECIES: AraC family transcriptional regulator [Hymenobacter]MBC6612339.1 helix-turn-helix transcriptional regulator [Hymenobacter citatus]MBO3272596.1 helix-turn-helix transcriptional regulator [Hymenobacter defluvii]MBW3130167.1 AraC family transcriptional regulator [Hymenobacter profundi]QNE41213.1 helix-turn-helix transcriptional regulator [Hymenobacter sp. NBH84]UOR04804.1 AraC family transcriptional regulator [Hymenobacter aerilatus]